MIRGRSDLSNARAKGPMTRVATMWRYTTNTCWFIPLSSADFAMMAIPAYPNCMNITARNGFDLSSISPSFPVFILGLRYMCPRPYRYCCRRYIIMKRAPMKPLSEMYGGLNVQPYIYMHRQTDRQTGGGSSHTSALVSWDRKKPNSDTFSNRNSGDSTN